MLTLQERLETVFPPPHRRGLYADIARLCGVKAPSVNAWFKNAVKVRALDRASAEKICSAYAENYSPRWLAEGVGERFAAPEGAAADSTATAGDELAQRRSRVVNEQNGSISGALDVLARYILLASPIDRARAKGAIGLILDDPETHLALQMPAVATALGGAVIDPAQSDPAKTG